MNRNVNPDPPERPGRAYDLPSSSPSILSSPSSSSLPLRTTTLAPHLPTHPHLQLPSHLTLPSDIHVDTLRHELSRTIPGAPAADAVRVIYKGRNVMDDEVVGDVWGRAGEVFIAIHPSGWSRAEMSRETQTPDGLPLKREHVKQEHSQVVLDDARRQLDIRLQDFAARASVSTSFPAPASSTPMTAPPATPSTSTPPSLFPPPHSVPLPLLLVDPAVDPHTASYSYYLYLYTTAGLILSGSLPPASPYSDEADMRAKVKAYVEGVLHLKSGLDGPTGCYLPTYAHTKEVAQYQTVIIDGLPYLLETASIPTPSSAHTAALQTLLSSQPLLHFLHNMLTVRGLFAPSPNVGFPNPNLFAPPANINANANPVGAVLANIFAQNANANANPLRRPRAPLQFHMQLHIPPLAFFGSLLAALFRVSFFCFLMTRHAGPEVKAAVVVVAAVWGAWEAREIVRRFGGLGLGQNANAGAGAAGAGAAPQPEQPAPPPAPGQAAPAPAPAAPAPPAPRPAMPLPPGQNPASPLLTWLSSLSLAADEARLFPSPTSPPLTPLQSLFSSSIISTVSLLFLSIVPEFNRLRAKALAEREQRVREVYGLVRRRGDAESSPEEQEARERTLEALGRLRERERVYVLRVLRGEMDDLAVMMAAADIPPDGELGGMFF